MGPPYCAPIFFSYFSNYECRKNRGTVRRTHFFPSNLRIAEIAWIICGPRLVQIQVALSEAVYVILRTQCHEVFGPRSGRPEGVKNADYILN